MKRKFRLSSNGFATNLIIDFPVDVDNEINSPQLEVDLHLPAFDLPEYIEYLQAVYEIVQTMYTHNSTSYDLHTIAELHSIEITSLN